MQCTDAKKIPEIYLSTTFKSRDKRPSIQLGYFLSHPIQYFSPLLKALAFKARLKVYYFSDASITGKKDKGFGLTIRWDTPLLEGYDYEFLKNISKSNSLNNRFWDVVNPGIFKVLWKEKAEVVIVNGWTYSSTLIVIFFARMLGKQVWLRAENPLNQELAKRALVIKLKKLFLKNILFRYFVSKCLYIGTGSRQFFEFYGVPFSKLVYTPYAVDNDYFQAKYKECKHELPAIRRELGLPADIKIILFSGKYIEKKRPMDLIRAFQLLDNPNYALVMVGEGELRGEMERFIAANDINQVYLTGFINQSLIPRYYAIADVFVMCSGAGETWGLSVNEAMNFEKTVVISKTCGSCADLVIHGENGFSFNEGDIPELAYFLKLCLEDDEFRLNAGKKSGQIIQSFSISHIVDNILAALPQTMADSL